MQFDILVWLHRSALLVRYSVRATLNGRSTVTHTANLLFHDTNFDQEKSKCHQRGCLKIKLNIYIYIYIYSSLRNRHLMLLETSERDLTISTFHFGHFLGNNHTQFYAINPLLLLIVYLQYLGGARGVMVIVVGNGHGDTSSNPGRD